MFIETTIEIIKKVRTNWAKHVMRSNNFLLSTVLEQNPVAKNPWKDQNRDWKM